MHKCTDMHTMHMCKKLTKFLNYRSSYQPGRKEDEPSNRNNDTQCKTDKTKQTKIQKQGFGEKNINDFLKKENVDFKNIKNSSRLPGMVTGACR